MFTVANLVAAGLLRAWDLPEDALSVRNFYYTNGWYKSFEMLPLTPASGLVAPATIRGRVAGLIDQFVSGEPLARMIRPKGHGMHPVFERMDSPNPAIVEMRTSEVRTFGIMGTKDTFIAVSLETKAELLDRARPNFDPYKEHADRCQALHARISVDEIDVASGIDALIT